MGCEDREGNVKGESITKKSWFGATLSLVSHTLANTTGSLSLGSKTTEFSVLLDTSGNPLVLWIHEDNFEVLVGRVFTDPVGVENTEGTAVTTDTLFGNRLKSASELHEDTLVNWFTHGGTLWYWLLASTTSDTDSVNDETLSGLVSQSSCLFRTSWS